MNYEEAARKYKPDKVNYLLIAESPPHRPTKEGKLRYFYFDNIIERDNLLRYIIEGVFSEEYVNTDKKLWLTKLKRFGYFLIDAVDYPIDNLPEGKERNNHVRKNIPILLDKIKKSSDNDTKIILIKKNIFKILSKKCKVF